MTSTVKKTVTIKSNQKNLLANLEYSFTNKTTLLGEMIQNARRAGATAVNVTFDEVSGLLTFADDGAGVADFQDLFSIADSGWDERIKASERPFGMGFMSTLYSSEHIRVESNGYFIEGNTKELLAGGTLTVEKAANAPASTYTEVQLSGVGLNAREVEYNMGRMACGFAIPVYLNGYALKQPYHLEGGLDFIEVPGIGYVSCEEFNPRDSQTYTHSMVSKHKVIYLQGLPIYGVMSEWDSYKSVIHLDPTLYFGRIPDRDKLVNEADALVKVDEAINKIHLDRLLKIKSEMSAEDFADKHIVRHALNIEGGFKLLCEKDVMLSSYFAGDVSEQQPSLYGNHDLTENSTDAVSFDDVQSGAVVCFDAEITDTDDLGLNAVWLFARRAGYKYVGNNASVRFNEHWVNPFIQNLNSDSIQVAVHGAEKEAKLALTYWHCNMVLCDHYTLTYINQETGIHTELKIDDEPLYTEDGKFLVPSKVTWISQESLFQADSYSKNDDIEEGELNDDESEINTFLKVQRTGDVNNALQSILSDINLDAYPDMVGKQFTLSIDSNLKMKLVEVIA